MYRNQIKIILLLLVIATSQIVSAQDDLSVPIATPLIPEKEVIVNKQVKSITIITKSYDPRVSQELQGKEKYLFDKNGNLIEMMMYDTRDSSKIVLKRNIDYDGVGHIVKDMRTNLWPMEMEIDRIEWEISYNKNGKLKQRKGIKEQAIGPSKQYENYLFNYDKDGLLIDGFVSELYAGKMKTRKYLFTKNDDCTYKTTIYSKDLLPTIEKTCRDKDKRIIHTEVTEIEKSRQNTSLDSTVYLTYSDFTYDSLGRKIKEISLFFFQKTSIDYLYDDLGNNNLRKYYSIINEEHNSEKLKHTEDWRYEFNKKGLIVIREIFNSSNKKTGRIEMSYEYW